MTSNPLVSVIVPNYNHASYLTQRFESIFNQTFVDFEVIILDDASTDNSIETIELFRNHPRVSNVHINKQNSGSPFKQWAKGIALSKGKYIWIAESDDYCAHEFLATLLPALQKDPQKGIAYCRSISISHDGITSEYSNEWMDWLDSKRWYSNFENDGYQECKDYLSIRCTIPNASAVIFNKQVFHDLDVNSINFKVCGDWYLYLQILGHYNIVYEATPLNFHRYHAGTARSKYQLESVVEHFIIFRQMKYLYDITKHPRFDDTMIFWAQNIAQIIKTIIIKRQINRLPYLIKLLTNTLKTESKFLKLIYKYI